MRERMPAVRRLKSSSATMPAPKIATTATTVSSSCAVLLPSARCPSRNGTTLGSSGKAAAPRCHSARTSPTPSSSSPTKPTVWLSGSGRLTASLAAPAVAPGEAGSCAVAPIAIRQASPNAKIPPNDMCRAREADAPNCVNLMMKRLLTASSGYALHPFDGKFGAQRLEKPLHQAVGVNPDLVGRGYARQARHGHDVAADHHEELGAVGQAYLADRHDVMAGRALEVGVGREAVLGLGDADREVAKSLLLALGELLAHALVGDDVIG